MSFLLVAQRALTVPGWVKTALWRTAKATPSLDLPFADSKSLVDAITGRQLVTFARFGSGTYVDSAGVLQTAATDVPRFDHNPLTGESLGLLVEEQRTNSIRNNTMVGAVAGTPGTAPTNWGDVQTSNGLNRQIVGIGTQNGITYIDIRYSGTATAAVSTTLQPELGAVTVAATGQSWTASSWLALVGGSTSGLTVVQRITGRTAAGGFLEFASTTVSLSSTLTRYVASITMTNASTLRVSSDIDITATAAGAAIDITLRIGLPQLEQGATASSVIPTTTAAATRNADVAQITGTNFSSWYRQDELTMFAQYNSTTWNADANFPKSFAIGTDDSNGFWIGGDTTDNVYRYRVRNGGVNQFGAATIPRTTITNNKTAIAVKASDFAVAADGGNLATGTTGSVPAATSMSIGSDLALNINFANQPIKRLTYWPQRLDNATLAAITQP